ncbi:unnamed protein product, partial [marine sediment metagenome]
MVGLPNRGGKVAGFPLGSIAKKPATHLQAFSLSGGSPFEGVEEPTVSGYIGARGAKAHLYPQGANCVTAVLPPGKTDGTPQKPPQKDDLLGYLEYEATSPSKLKLTASQKNGRMCGSLALLGEDENGNRIAKRIVCGREWCENCRDISHRRRIARVLPRLFQIDEMGYLVITFPLKVRWLMRDPQVLALIGKKVRRLLRKRGYRKVYTRWHFFGEHGEKYHPHLNVLCDGGYLTPEELASLKDLICRKLLSPTMRKIGGSKMVIHYDYTQEAKRKVHWIKYVTKASFRDIEWDEALAHKLYGFHNGCFAGTWNDPPKWKLTGTDKKFNALLP